MTRTQLDLRIEEVTREAEGEFWRKVAQSFPEAKYGDLDPFTTLRLLSTMIDAVREWVANNTALFQEKEVLPSFTEIRRTEDLGKELEDNSYMGVAGWLFLTPSGSKCFAYEYEGKAIVPLGRDEFTYDTPELAAQSTELLEFAVGEGMFDAKFLPQ